ncbi:MAG: SMR family transporter [Bacteroidota bacterium]
MKYALLFSAIIANILTNVGFNFSALNDSVPVKKWGYLAGGLVFGLINSVLFTESLKQIPLGVASAIFFSLTIVGLYLVAHFYFGEEVTPYRILGGAFITVGVIIISVK